MMWYGRMTFRAKDEDETRSAALMTLALHEAEVQTPWASIYDTTEFLPAAVMILALKSMPRPCTRSMEKNSL